MKHRLLLRQPLTAIQTKTWAQLRRRGRGRRLISCLRKQSKKRQMEAFKKSQRKAKKGGKKKRRRKSVFDVVALPEELERLVAEQMAVKKRLMKSLMQKSRRKCFQQEVALAAGQAHGAEVAVRTVVKVADLIPLKEGYETANRY